MARAQLAKGPQLIGARRTAASALSARLRQLPGIIVPQDPPGTSPSWWLYNLLIDETRVGVNPDTICDALGMEGVPAMRRYLPRPLFEEDVIAKRNTFGNSGFPFSATDYVQPKMEDLPGLSEFFRRQIILAWNSRLTAQHVDGVANAVEKLLRAATPASEARASSRREGYLPNPVENRRS